MTVPKKEREDVCPDFWFNLEGWDLIYGHVVCCDFDCYCGLCMDYKAELLD